MFGGTYGVVRDAVSGDAIRNAAVTLSPGNYTYTTGNDGQFQFSDLEAGSYTLRCVASGYNSNSRQITVYAGENIPCDFQMTKQTSVASITISTNSIDFGTTSTEEVFSISNTGNAGTVSWNISKSNVPWLTVTPSSGSTAQGKSSTITVRVDRTKVTKDELTYITINAAGGSHSVAVSVKYVSDEKPKEEQSIALSTDSIDFGTTSTEEVFSISNTGNAGTVSWNISKSNVPWLTVTPSSGSTAQGKSSTITVRVDRTKVTKDELTYVIINAAGGSHSVAVSVKYSSSNDDPGNDNPKGEAVVGFNTDILDFGTTESELTLLVANLEEATADLNWELGKEYPSCLSFSMTSGKLEPGYYHTVIVNLNRDKMTSDIDTEIKIYDLADNYNYYYSVNIKAKNVVKEEYSSATVQSCDNRITAEIVSCKRSGGSVVFEYRLTNVNMGYINDWRIYPTNSMSIMSGCYRSTVVDNIGNEYFYSLFTFRDASGKTNVVGGAFPDGMTCKGSVTVYDVDPAATKLSIMLGVAVYNHSKQLADNRIYFKNVPIY